MSDIARTREDSIRAYLAGKLDGAELEHFELALFTDSELLAEVEAERALAQGLRDVDAELAARVVRLSPRKPKPWQRVVPLAATFLLGAILPGLLLLQQSRRSAPDSAARNVQVLMVEQLRSIASIPQFRIDPNAPRVVLQFPVLAEAGVRDYTLELSSSDGRNLRFDGLHSSTDGLLSIDLVATQLAHGAYTANILATRNDGTQTPYLVQRFELTQ